MSDHFSVDTADLRKAGKRLESKANEIGSLGNAFAQLIDQACRALGNDSGGKQMATQLRDNAQATTDAVASYAEAIRSGGKGFRSAADAFVATEEGASQMAQNFAGGTATAASLDHVGSGGTTATTTGTTTGNNGGTSTSPGKH